MSYSVAPLERLIEQLERLPGIGHKSAQRLAFFLLNQPEKNAADFVSAITEAREKIHECAVCRNLTDQDLCPICRAGNRDASVICVVEDPRDVMAFERTREYAGLYHVLHGTISHGGGRSDGHVYLQAAQAFPGQGDPAGLRHSGGRRSGVRRRGHPAPVAGGTQRAVGCGGISAVWKRPLSRQELARDGKPIRQAM